MPEIKLTLAEAMTRAVACHQASDFLEAERLYKAILSAKPDHADALHLMGVLECQKGFPECGIDFIDQALALVPDLADALSNRGNALCTLKRQQEALESYDRALQINPENFATHCRRGILLRELNRPEEALISFNDALAIRPDAVEVLCHRGNTLGALQRFGEALDSYDKVLAIKPDNVDALCGRGRVLRDLKRTSEAIASFDKALAIQPDRVDGLANRGHALYALNRLDEALANYNQALELDAEDVEALSGRAIVLRKFMRSEEALESLEMALRVQPHHAELLYNRGRVLLDLNRLEEALVSFDQALAIRPDHGWAQNNRGSALLGLNRVPESIASFQRALAINSDPTFHSNLIFALNFDEKQDAVAHQAERTRWYELHAKPFQGLIRTHDNRADPDRQLRIAYASRYFRDQAATYAFGGVILRHDPSQFDVICYSDTTEKDDVTARLHRSVHTWRDTAELSDDEFAEQVRADRIDILVDCVGHMRGHRLLVFARKPAPIQVTAWGEPTGTGLKTIDYLLADPVLVPVSERHLLAERVIDLPNFLTYWAPDPLPHLTPLPSLANGFVTFGSFNRIVKIQDRVLRTWAAILRELPKARLTLKLNQRSLETCQLKRLETLLGDESISMERVKVIGGTRRADHFAAYQEIDIALDPFPHGGGMTTLDALWMGVPVITCVGRTISSRLAAASLTTLNLTDFIARDLDGYVELAVAKATNLQALARTRASLRARLAQSDIGNEERYTRAVEGAYREMWKTWCSRNR